MQSPFASSHLNSTQTITSPMPISSPTTVIQSPIKPLIAQNPKPTSYEEKCRQICLDRFKFVLITSIFIQFLLIMTFSLLTFNFSYLHPVVWCREFLSTLMSPLTLMIVVFELLTLNNLLKENVYCPTRISKFMRNFGHESILTFLNMFIGLFTSRLFMRCLSDDYKLLANKSNELNESYSFLLLAGLFMRFYCYYNEKRAGGLNFSGVHQSKLQQCGKLLKSTVRTSLVKSLLPTAHFLAFYVIFGSSFSYFLRRIFFLEVSEKSGFISNFTMVYDVKLIFYAWLLSSLILSYTQIVSRLTDIFATESNQFAVASSSELIITKALEINKNHITQHLAAQDLFTLADNANAERRKEFYALSVPGSHPHNWKQLVKVVLTLIDNFTNELKTNVDYVAKNRRNDTSLNILNNPIQKFYEHKQMTRQQNETLGIRSFMPSSPIKPIVVEEKKEKFVPMIKQKLLSFRIFAFLFGEEESAKLNFILSQNSQIVIWLTQGISALVARSLEEDSYGVVQYDIKAILKSFIKLRAALEKVSAINTIAKDRNLYALKAALRRSIYRITTNFSQYFDDMIMDAEDIRALSGFITFKEL